MWSTKIVKNGTYQKLLKYQKINQFPKSYELTRKDLLMRRIQSMQEQHGVRHFSFYPYSVSLPREYETLREEMERDPYQWWIIKPSSSSQGKGIIITNKIKDVFERKEKCQIASHYISNPLLIDGLKFDLRIYVALTSVDPLRIYMYEEGLTRFATT